MKTKRISRPIIGLHVKGRFHKSTQIDKLCSGVVADASYAYNDGLCKGNIGGRCISLGGYSFRMIRVFGIFDAS